MSSLDMDDVKVIRVPGAELASGPHDNCNVVDGTGTDNGYDDYDIWDCG
jgi:hypothetical protein